MYAACFEAKEEPDRNYDINYFVYENNEEYFIETYISGKSDVSTAYLGKCGAERAENSKESVKAAVKELCARFILKMHFAILHFKLTNTPLYHKIY